MNKTRDEIASIESELKLIPSSRTNQDKPEAVFQHIFGAVEDIVSIRSLSNAQLKQLIRIIEVDQNGNVDIYLRSLQGPGPDENVLFYNACT